MPSFRSKLSALRAAADRAARGIGLTQVVTGAKKLGKVTQKQVERLAKQPIAKLIDLLKSPGKKTGAVGREREIQAAADFLTAAGFEVIPPGKRQTPVVLEWGEGAEQAFEIESEPAMRPIPVDEEKTGEISNEVTMIRVQSSNVHSIGYREEEGRRGTLFIRFLATVGKRRAGPGALYEYYDVPLSLWTAFESASSKGTFVWDNIRVRGTVSGHRYSYELSGTGPRGYIPRRAGLKRGQSGEFYLRRQFKGRSSGLPERKVHDRGPNPARGPGAGKMILKRGRRRE